MLTLTGDNFLIVRVEKCFDFFICSQSQKLHIFSTDLVIEFIAGGIEINLLAFSYKKATGRGRWEITLLQLARKKKLIFRACVC